MARSLLDEIVNGSREAASTALGAYMNGASHQGLYFEHTWEAVAELVPLLRSTSPVRAEVMAAIGALVPSPEPLPRSVAPERGTSAVERGPHVDRTVKAVREARAELERALDDDDVELRCAAAWALSRLGDEAAPALRARLAQEPDPRAHTSLVIALGGGPGDSDAEVVLRASAPLDDRSAAAFSRLLAAAPTPWLRFEHGLISSFAARALGRLGRDEPRAIELLLAAHAVALPRVLSGPAPRYQGDEMRVSETRHEYLLGWQAQSAWDGLAALENLLGWLVLGDRRAGPPLRRSELDARLEAVLPIVFAEIEHPPRRSSEGIEAFLRGGPVLDEVLDVAGVRAPICEHVWRVVEHGGWNAFDAPLLDALCDSALDALSPDRAFELATSLLDEELPYIKLPCKRVVAIRFAPVVTNARAIDWARRHPARLTQHQKDLATLLSAPWLPEPVLREPVPQNEAPPPELDVVVSALLFDVDARNPRFDTEPVLRWLRAFPPARLATLVAHASWTSFPRCAPLCDPRDLDRAVLDAFLSPDCTWADHTAYERLKSVDLDLLRAAAVNPTRARVMNRLLSERGEVARFELRIEMIGEQVRLSLSRDETPLVVIEVPSAVDEYSLAPLAEHLRVAPRRVITLSSDGRGDPAYHDIEYGVQLAVSALARPAAVTCSRGTRVESAAPVGDE